MNNHAEGSFLCCWNWHERNLQEWNSWIDSSVTLPLTHACRRFFFNACLHDSMSVDFTTLHNKYLQELCTSWCCLLSLTSSFRVLLGSLQTIVLTTWGDIRSFACFPRIGSRIKKLLQIQRKSLLFREMTTDKTLGRASLRLKYDSSFKEKMYLHLRLLIWWYSEGSDFREHSFPKKDTINSLTSLLFQVRKGMNL